MNYKTKSFAVDNIATLKQQMLNWVNQFNICCFLDNCNSIDNYHTHEIIVAVDAFSSFSIEGYGPNWKTNLDNYLSTNNATVFGHIAYNFKSVILKESKVLGKDEMPLLYFFQPKIILKFKHNFLEISSIYSEPASILSEIKSFKINSNEENLSTTSIVISPTQTKQEYLNTISELKKEIAKGNCYEINYCTEFLANNVLINPIDIYTKLTTISPTPFASFYKYNNHFTIAATPERFLKKVGAKIISQPIKGTIKTDVTNKQINEQLKHSLQHSKKDKAENVMVVDLVRNDLSRICKAGSVCTEELFEVYSFKQVHQMISTIVGELEKNTQFSDILEATFPMGSMTGAPKFKVMQLVEQYETMNRGIYSGSIGYINKNSDFDFNVVIRSIFYNSKTNQLSYKVGSGITHYSIPENEYEECLLKAKAIEAVLGSNS